MKVVKNTLPIAALPLLVLLCVGTFAADPGAAQSRMAKVHLTPYAATAGFAWQELASEDAGDVRSPNLPDATSLSWYHEEKSDLVWFKITLHEPLHPDWFGVNVAVDTDRDQSNGMNWWGTNRGFKFDKLVTVYLSNAQQYYQGLAGISDPDHVTQGTMDHLAHNNIKVVLDEERKTLILGVPRGDLDEDLEMNAICTVGSTFIPNDDLPNSDFVTIGAAPEAAAEAAAGDS